MLNLRDFMETDIPLFTEWLNKDYVKKWYSETEEWLKEVSSEDFAFVHHFIVMNDGKPIGFCQYYEYSQSGENWHGNTDIKAAYSIDYLIGEKDCLGKGFGTKMLKLLTERTFQETNAVKIIVKPEKENAASRNTLLSAGFSYDEENDIFIFKRQKSCR
jgi:RimJ/RimL family protein N-acetyltransferase